MAKLQMKELMHELLDDFLKENDLEIYNTEFKKEGRDWYLRVFLDKAGCPEGVYISSDDCELVSRYLSEQLDEKDPIKQNYILEVSSPGMDRQLFEEKDYIRFTGEIVDVKLYKPVDGKKEYQGTLLGLQDNTLKIRDEEDNELEFPMEQVAKTNLAVIF